MQRLRMICEICGRQGTVSGPDLEVILTKLTESGWYDQPSKEEPGEILFWCPKCRVEYLAEEDEY